jgi:hypothetical protein
MDQPIQDVHDPDVLFTISSDPGSFVRAMERAGIGSAAVHSLLMRIIGIEAPGREVTFDDIQQTLDVLYSIPRSLDGVYVRDLCLIALDRMQRMLRSDDQAASRFSALFAGLLQELAGSQLIEAEAAELPSMALRLSAEMTNDGTLEVPIASIADLQAHEVLYLPSPLNYTYLIDQIAPFDQTHRSFETALALLRAVHYFATIHGTLPDVTYPILRNLAHRLSEPEVAQLVAESEAEPLARLLPVLIRRAEGGQIDTSLAGILVAVADASDLRALPAAALCTLMEMQHLLPHSAERSHIADLLAPCILHLTREPSPVLRRVTFWDLQVNIRAAMQVIEIDPAAGRGLIDACIWRANFLGRYSYYYPHSHCTASHATGGLLGLGLRDFESSALSGRSEPLLNPSRYLWHWSRNTRAAAKAIGRRPTRFELEAGRDSGRSNLITYQSSAGGVGPRYLVYPSRSADRGASDSPLSGALLSEVEGATARELVWAYWDSMDRAAKQATRESRDRRNDAARRLVHHLHPTLDRVMANSAAELRLILVGPTVDLPIYGACAMLAREGQLISLVPGPESWAKVSTGTGPSLAVFHRSIANRGSERLHPDVLRLMSIDGQAPLVARLPDPPTLLDHPLYETIVSLTTACPRVIHIAMHGSIAEGSWHYPGANDPKRAATELVGRLVQRFGEAPELVFLSGCHAGRSSTVSELAGPVSSLLGFGVKYVIGSIWEITETDAQDVAERLYSLVGQGVRVDLAAQLVIGAMTREGREAGLALQCWTTI